MFFLTRSLIILCLFSSLMGIGVWSVGHISGDGTRETLGLVLLSISSLNARNFAIAVSARKEVKFSGFCEVKMSNKILHRIR